MIARATHLREERLLDCYLAERSDEPVDPRVAEHLTDCQACALRYAELARFMDALRNEADGETNAIFTSDRLLLQQAQIAKRLEPVGRAARVISFPGGAAGRHVDGGIARRLTPRWVAGAVAAGLFLGVALGASFRWDRRLRNPQPLGVVLAPIAAPARLAPVGTDGINPAVTADDDAFLSDLEMALESPRTRELQPFDAITPHVREITNLR